MKSPNAGLDPTVPDKDPPLTRSEICLCRGVVGIILSNNFPVLFLVFKLKSTYRIMKKQCENIPSKPTQQTEGNGHRQGTAWHN